VTQEPLATLAYPVFLAILELLETLVLQVTASCTVAEVGSLSWFPLLKACRCHGKKGARRTTRF
jgi:hypothetical protein